jgi:6-phosphogluconolactonase
MAMMTTIGRTELWEIYLGTYTKESEPEAARGIYRLTLDGETGAITPPQLLIESVSPAFLALHPSGDFLYAVHETNKFLGQSGGGVSAYERHPVTGQLTLLNQQSVGAQGPCHLAVDATGRTLIVANYGSGSVSVFPISPTGSLAPRSDYHQHSGTGPQQDRQEGPHAHGITFSLDNRFVYVPDLGIDQVRIYRLDSERAQLIPQSPPFVATAAGAGPRHFSFSPNGRHGYAINELNNTITVFEANPQSGALLSRQVVTTLPVGYTEKSSTAEIAVHPSGAFVYCSNRGHNSIAVFRRDLNTGALTPLGQVPTGGREPRSFALSPDGRWLIAANQFVQTLQVFRVDPVTGILEPQGQPMPALTPVCVLFVPKKK